MSVLPAGCLNKPGKVKITEELQKKKSKIGHGTEPSPLHVCTRVIFSGFNTAQRSVK